MPPTTDYNNIRKSGQIPAFGDWENADDMPITQYFECARQAGLLRCSCSGECCGSYTNNAAYWGGAGGGDSDLYGVGLEKTMPRRVYSGPPRKVIRGSNKSYQHSKEQRKQVKVRDLMDHDQTRNHNLGNKNYSKQPNNKPISRKPSLTIKPVDEDLYKIPSELLENSKRKKMLGFFSRCITVPPCVA